MRFVKKKDSKKMAPWTPATPTPTEPNTDASYRVLDSATDTSRAVFEKVNA